VSSRPDFTKPPPELIERFDRLIADLPDVQRKLMFGMPAGFVAGQMATGLVGPDWHVRLPEDGQSELLAVGGRPFEPMPGRPMRGYVLLPRDWHEAPDRIRPWLERAVDHTRSLPPKPPKAKKRG
jgi:TfoX/Sxy family transcriptional regulator of competence genes